MELHAPLDSVAVMERDADENSVKCVISPLQGDFVDIISGNDPIALFSFISPEAAKRYRGRVSGWRAGSMD